MLRYIFKRLLLLIPVLLVVDIITFVLVKSAPGGPFDSDKALPPAIEKQLNAYYGYDKSWPEQFAIHLKNIVLKGDFGPSTKLIGYSVNEIIAQSLPISLQLGFFGLLLALILGIPIGLLAASRKNTFSDYFPMAASMMGICLPTFVIGPVLLLIFSVYLGWFNPFGWNEMSDKVLPIITLGIFYAAYIARLTRSGTLDILNQDFIRTAHSKGLSESTVLRRHALKGSLLPVVNFIGPAFAGLLTGSFVVETIYYIPGLGRYFVNAAFNRDYSLVQATVLLYASMLVVMNLVTDVIMAYLNPRIRIGEQ